MLRASQGATRLHRFASELGMTRCTASVGRQLWREGDFLPSLTGGWNRGGRLERDEAGVAMGQGWKGLGGGEPSGSRGGLGRVCNEGVCAGRERALSTVRQRLFSSSVGMGGWP